MARTHPDPHSRGTTLSEWMSSDTWAQCRNLEEVNPEVYKNLGDELQTDFDWREWFELEKPETETMPGPFAGESFFFVFVVFFALFIDLLTDKVQPLSRFVRLPPLVDHSVDAAGSIDVGADAFCGIEHWGGIHSAALVRHPKSHR